MSDTPLDLTDLVGKWYINLSNFPMWLNPKNTSPTFNYSIQQKGEITGLKDEVKYFKNGKSRIIKGFDKPLNTDNTSFMWRGTGLLGVASSLWKVAYINYQAQWAIIVFEKTIFTPQGIDVISKEKQLSKSMIDVINVKLKTLGLSTNLKVIQQDIE